MRYSPGRVVEMSVCISREEHEIGISLAGGLPFDVLTPYGPLRAFTGDEIEQEALKQSSHLVVIPREVSKSSRTRGLVDQQGLKQQVADVEQESIAASV